jgi:polyferredoxin
MRRARQGVQVLTLALYVYLLFGALHTRAVFPLADLFFRLDPLAAVASTLAARAWIPRMALALPVVALTLLVGRVWCGWLCPLGTLLEWVRFPKATQRRVDPRWRRVKYALLAVVLVMALLGSLTLLILDPITLLTRTMTTVVLPGVNYVVTAVARALYPIPFLRGPVLAVEGVLRGQVIPVQQPVFRQNVLLGLLFLGVLALNALADRFWCRYLCPLGGLLGLLSRFSLLRPQPNQACNRCGQCVRACRVDAIDPAQDYEVIPSECLVSLDCLAGCPQAGFGFGLYPKPAPAQPFDPSRRQLLASAGAAAAGVFLLRSGPQLNFTAPTLIRPPGVEDEDAFLARCIRCSQCMKVCPTSVLQPTLTQAGLAGLWTPMLVPRLGYCDYGCKACGDICPTDAIPTLSLEEKRQQVLGLARVDRDRCLPWAYDTPCIVCEEMCPVPEKAIQLEEVTITGADGAPTVLQQPYVLRELCIGCGICETKCPMEGEAAIRVFLG